MMARCAEQEQEVEIEKYVELAYSRDDEAQVHWKFDDVILAKQASRHGGDVDDDDDDDDDDVVMIRQNATRITMKGRQG
jgi:hypothetical protein